MAPRRDVSHEDVQINLVSIHPLYRFPQNISRDLLTTYENRLGWLYNKEFAIAPIVDWTWLREVGLVSELERFWTKVYEGLNFTFTCHKWRNLFAIQEPVYRELSVEFFATVGFEERTVDFDYNRALVFRLGGVHRECGLREFAWRM